MKKIFLLLGFVLMSVLGYGQIKGTGIWYFNGSPLGVNPNLANAPEFAFDVNNRIVWVYNRSTLTWERYGTVHYGSGLPTADGSQYKAYLDKDTGKWWRYDVIRGAWLEIGGVGISPESSPILVKDDNGDLKVDFGNLLPTETDDIANAMIENDSAMTLLRDSVLIEIQTDSGSLVVKKQLRFKDNEGFMTYKLKGTQEEAILVSEVNMYKLSPQQVDSMIQRVTEEKEVMDLLRDSLGLGGSIDSLREAMSGLVDTIIVKDDSTFTVRNLNGNEYDVKIVGNMVESMSSGGSNNSGVRNILFQGTNTEYLLSGVGQDTTIGFSTENSNILDVKFVGNTLFVNLKGGEEGKVLGYLNGAYVWTDGSLTLADSTGSDSSGVFEIQIMDNSSPALVKSGDSIGFFIENLTSEELGQLVDAITADNAAFQTIIDELNSRGIDSKFDSLYAVNDSTLKVVTNWGEYEVEVKGNGGNGGAVAQQIADNMSFTNGPPASPPSTGEPWIAIDGTNGSIYQWDGTMWVENQTTGGSTSGGDGVAQSGSLNVAMKKIDIVVNGGTNFSVDMTNIGDVIGSLDWSKIVNAPPIPQTLDDLEGGANTAPYSKTDSIKLAQLNPNAEENVQADWNVSDVNDDAFIKNKPSSLPPAAHTHTESDITDLNHFSGAYADLTGKPTLFDGDYNSLSNLPSLFSGSWNDLTDKPNLFSGDYNSLTNLPSLFSGSYTDLTNKPTSFPTTWGDVSGKPTVFATNWTNVANIPADILDGDDNTTYTAGDGIDISNGVISTTGGAASGGWTHYEKIEVNSGSGNSVVSSVSIPSAKTDVKVVRDGIEVTNYTLSGNTIIFPINFYPPEVVEIFKK